LRKLFGLLFASIVVVAMLGVAGCGDDKNDNSSTTTPTAATPTTDTTSTTPDDKGGGATKLQIAADKSALKFDKTELKAKAGKVTIAMDNPSAIPHSVGIDGNGVDKDGTGGKQGVGQGEVSTVSVDLKPGTYTFYCPVDGHEQAGMKGTLTVE